MANNNGKLITINNSNYRPVVQDQVDGNEEYTAYSNTNSFNNFNNWNTPTDYSHSSLSFINPDVSTYFQQENSLQHSSVLEQNGHSDECTSDVSMSVNENAEPEHRVKRRRIEEPDGLKENTIYYVQAKKLGKISEIRKDSNNLIKHILSYKNELPPDSRLQSKAGAKYWIMCSSPFSIHTSSSAITVGESLTSTSPPGIYLTQVEFRRTAQSAEVLVYLNHHQLKIYFEIYNPRLSTPIAIKPVTVTEVQRVSNIMFLVPHYQSFMVMANGILTSLFDLEATSDSTGLTLYSYINHTKLHVLLFPYGDDRRLLALKDYLPQATEVLLCLFNEQMQEQDLMGIEAIEGMPQKFTQKQIEDTMYTKIKAINQAAKLVLKVNALQDKVLGGVSCNKERDITQQLKNFFVHWAIIENVAESSSVKIYLCFKYEEHVRAFTEYALATLTALKVCNYKPEAATVAYGSILLYIRCPYYITWRILQHKEEILHKLGHYGLVEIYESFVSDVEASIQLPANAKLIDHLNQLKEQMIEDGIGNQPSLNKFSLKPSTGIEAQFSSLVIAESQKHINEERILNGISLAKEAFNAVGSKLAIQELLKDLKLPQKKIVVVGEENVGKTSLIKGLKNVQFYSFRPSTRTEGVDIHSIEISKGQYLSVWDFAGQEHFLSSHKLYFTKNSVFIVVVQLIDSINVIKDQLSKWLFMIHQLCPDSHVIVVATKVDLITKENLQERAVQLDHILGSIQKELEINIVRNPNSQSKYLAISNVKSVHTSIILELLQELSKDSAVQSLQSSISLLHSIKSCREECIQVKELTTLSNMPVQHCIKTLTQLEELGMIVYVESTAEDEDATVILNGDVISKAFNKLKMKVKELTKSELTGWIDYNLAKSTVSPNIKFKMFIDVIEKAKLVYVDRQSDYETQWKIFIPHIVLENSLQMLSKDSASFSAGRLFYFKYQLPIGFFEHLAIQMQFLVKLASYSIMMSSYGIKIVGHGSVVLIEQVKLDGEFINAIRITIGNNNALQLFHKVLDAIEESLFSYFKNDNDVHKFVKHLVLCSCQHCQAKFKSNQLTKKHYLPLTQDDSIQEGTVSILTRYIKGFESSGCIDSNANIPLNDLLVELQVIKHLPFIDYNTIKMHKHEVRGKGGFGAVRVGELSNGQKVAVKEINDVQAAFKEIKILGRVNHKHIVKVLGYSHNDTSACMFIITELLDKSLRQLIAEMNGSLASDLSMLIRIALNVAKGISYLHSQHPPIIHRDIKPDNIMLDEAMNAKINDFGVAKQTALPYLSERQGTPGYCAPEVINQMKYNSAVDIYSFGCVLFAMCGDMSKMSPLLEPFETLLPTLIAKCCDKEPTKRPTALNCVEQLETILEVAQLKKQLKALRLTIRDNAGSADCLPYSLIDYLKVLTDFQGDCTALRQLIANYVRQNWHHLVETYPNNIGAIISNEDEANQWAEQYQQPQQWCDTVFACICACVFRLQVDIFVMTEHRTLERMMFKPVDADPSQPIIRIAYVNQNHFVSVWPDSGDELFDTDNESVEELPGNISTHLQHEINTPAAQHNTRQNDQSKARLQEVARDIPETDLMLTQKLGEGGFGEVWLGQWRGIKVAVKKMKSVFMAERFRNELQTLSWLRYKHIVTLHGVSTDSKTGNLMLVMEYMKHGSLDDLLFNQKFKMSLADFIQIALDVAKGINFLHMQKPIIIHRNIKSNNILLHLDKKRAKIADFGAAKALHSNIRPKTVIGAVGIAMPPEMMDELTYDEKVDIFSFGVVLYEMLTSERLRVMEDHNQRFARIRANVSNKDLAELIVTCCAVDPKQRPSINTVINELKVFKKKMPQ